jgi:predicted metal-dependent hydrolase
MPVLRIGRTEIPYKLVKSPAASERRITVTPGHVEVLVLKTDDAAAVDAFLRRKRQWLFNTVREMARATARRPSVPGFITGSKVPYRGRQMLLTVRRTDAERAAVTFRNGFIVDLPYWVDEDTDRMVASELKFWLKQRARRDVQEFAKELGKRFGTVPHSVRVVDLAQGWGSCGPQGNISINWHLIFAPRQVLEYVVAHELAHLRYRTHGAAFWSFLETILPDYITPKVWLENHQTLLTADFLKPG